jgi:hypothetical protein
MQRHAGMLTHRRMSEKERIGISMFSYNEEKP